MGAHGHRGKRSRDARAREREGTCAEMASRVCICHVINVSVTCGSASPPKARLVACRGERQNIECESDQKTTPGRWHKTSRDANRNGQRQTQFLTPTVTWIGPNNLLRPCRLPQGCGLLAGWLASCGSLRRHCRRARCWRAGGGARGSSLSHWAQIACAHVRQTQAARGSLAACPGPLAPSHAAASGLPPCQVLAGDMGGGPWLVQRRDQVPAACHSRWALCCSHCSSAFPRSQRKPVTWLLASPSTRAASRFILCLCRERSCICWNARPFRRFP